MTSTSLLSGMAPAERILRAWLGQRWMMCTAGLPFSIQKSQPR